MHRGVGLAGHRCTELDGRPEAAWRDNSRKHVPILLPGNDEATVGECAEAGLVGFSAAADENGRIEPGSVETLAGEVDSWRAVVIVFPGDGNGRVGKRDVAPPGGFQVPPVGNGPFGIAGPIGVVLLTLKRPGKPGICPPLGGR